MRLLGFRLNFNSFLRLKVITKSAKNLKFEILPAKTKLTTPESPQPFSYGDRFIPRRYAFKDLPQIEKLYSKTKGFDDILDMRLQSGYWRWHNFRVVMNNSFGIKPCRIYQFADLMVNSSLFSHYNISPKIKSEEIIYGNKLGLDWPCHPRPRPLGFADSTHDLPGFNLYSELNVIAWSSRGQIAASFGKDLVLWNPETDSTTLYKIRKSKAIAFNPKGDIMAVGSLRADISVLELWDVATETRGLRSTKEYTFSSKDDEVRCIEWDSTGQILVCGTHSGTIYFFNSSTLNKIKEIKNHKLPISSIKFSPKTKYLATSDVQGNIYVLLWNSCDIHVRLVSQRKLKTMMDWHPWNGTDLVISEELPASIVILNAPSKKIVAYYQRKDYSCRIDSVAFNKLSGELVVAYTIRDSNNCVSNEIVVMASLDRIVDVLKSHDDSIKFLLWSPDNTQLATAGDDDTLTIWNFFGSRDNNMLQKIFKKSKTRGRSENLFSNQFADILNTYVKHSKQTCVLK